MWDGNRKKRHFLQAGAPIGSKAGSRLKRSLIMDGDFSRNFKEDVYYFLIAKQRHECIDCGKMINEGSHFFLCTKKSLEIHKCMECGLIHFSLDEGLRLFAQDMKDAGVEVIDMPGEKSGIPIEVIKVPNYKPITIVSMTRLEKGKAYIIDASGCVSNWDNKNDGIDAIYCYAKWRIGDKEEAWAQLRIDGKCLPEIAGQDIPYNSGHVYRVRYVGTGKQMESNMNYTQKIWNDNSEGIIIPDPGVIFGWRKSWRDKGGLITVKLFIAD
jgi:hypothetical protein